MTPVAAADRTGMVTAYEEDWRTDEAMLDRLIARHEPTVFRGVAAAWLPEEAAGSSALDWLERLIGHRVVPVSIGLPGDSGFIGTAAGTGGHSSTTLSGRRAFRDIAREMRAETRAPTGHALYVQSLPVDTHVPELKPFLKLPIDWLPKGGHWRAWIGTGSHHVHLHTDGTENIFCLLAGRKRFVLCPFDVLPDAYVGPLEGGAFKSPASIVDPTRPDPGTYPRFAAALARSVVVELEAGDVLYLPSGWWHHVEAEGFNFSVNYWWYDIDERARADAELVFMQSLLSLRALPRHWRHFWKVMLDHFVFRCQGDPYGHLSVDEQGFAGDPTPARIMFLRARIAESAARTNGTGVAAQPAAIGGSRDAR